MNTKNQDFRTVQVTANDLPVFCPTATDTLWSGHPKVYLDPVRTGEATCPYCSTRFVFSGEKPKGH